MHAARNLQDSALPLLCALLQVGIFGLDPLIPPGVAMGVLYTPALLLCLWSSQPYWVVALTASGIVLIVVGYFLPRPPAEGVEIWPIVANRVLAVVTLAGAGLLVLQRHRVIAAMRETAANLQAVQRLTGSGDFQLGAGDGSGDQWSDRVLEILGRPATDRLTREDFFERHVHADDRADVREAFAAALEKGRPFYLDFRLLRADGSTRYVQSAGEPLGWRDGEVARVLCSLLDVTHNKQIEEALQARKARLRSILETAPEAIITINASGIVESFSTAAERMFGYAADEVIGKNVSLLMPSPDRERHDAYLRRYLETGEARIIGIGRVVEGRRKDGTIVPIELAVGEIVLNGERIFTGFLRDLTLRQRMEQELRQAQKMEAIGQLAGGIAHDFNNLMTVILGNLEMLDQRLQGDGRQQDLIAEMRETAELGTQLADRLLMFGRRQSLQSRSIDVADLLAGMSTLLRRTLGENIEIRTNVAADLSRASADPAQLQNAILNLALNARDAMPRGGTLTIAAKDVEPETNHTGGHPTARRGRYVMITVTDTGTGMAPEVLERAFEPFFTTKETRSGTGLGLSMVYGFAVQTGGDVQIDSAPGAGTTVRLYLPVSRDDPLQTPDAEIAEAPKGEGETVLVVEDDPAVRRVSVRRVEELGYRVIAAGSGPEALRHLEMGARVDLLFTDVIMPGGMTGVELAQRVRQEYPGTAVLLTSGYAEPELLGLAGIEEWALLKKPYSALGLAKTLREVLDRSSFE